MRPQSYIFRQHSSPTSLSKMTSAVVYVRNMQANITPGTLA
ncbi:hypothetical protein MIZ03_2704 [Rhodoferax lithotrophicus]|uniref:Uncharacterized protein n=1 Tax=Rhodoferax lithotrophicus TaxID=2798804 RepID=A0ABM7MNF9_9BURK|nr:hypothetical protein MIZ03_2704 [Rhodoferax sp. MIZ03]